jgi:hypothetical protein
MTVEQFFQPVVERGCGFNFIDHGYFVACGLRFFKRETERPCYFMDNGKWYAARAEDTVWGQIIGEGIVVMGLER